jgi:hypothetical protein
VSGIPYKQAKVAQRWAAVVIASDIVGLTAAVLLGLYEGKRALSTSLRIPEHVTYCAHSETWRSVCRKH